VRLSGYTLTSGQMRHAEPDAWSVSNVKHVVNEIRPRVGGISS
jgi:osmotically-inducible protein OsmY